MSQNPWDILGQKTFNTQLQKGEIDPRAADNILVAWPPILKLLKSEYPKTHGVIILDFGCGAGGFCSKLDSLGYEVTGMDPSVMMIESAKQRTPPTVRYILGDQKNIPSGELFDVITSIMTFPFIENIRLTFEHLTHVLKPGGLFIIAVFNPEWVKESLKKNMWFTHFDSIDNPKAGMKTFGKLQIPIFIRNAEKYTTIAKSCNLHPVSEEYPVFTPEFIQKYPDYYPNNISEYIILGYRKEVRS